MNKIEILNTYLLYPILTKYVWYEVNADRNFLENVNFS